ncbi:MAG TPA: hypothetical protein VFH08_08740 [Chitinophagaceae bacterium]|nr:hypothetical protein [Chitinophagaceae bacterium]
MPFRRGSLIVPLFIFPPYFVARRKTTTDNYWKIVHPKKTMIESSKIAICLAIAETVNTIPLSQPFSNCGIDRRNMLTGNVHVDNPFAQALCYTMS